MIVVEKNNDENFTDIRAIAKEVWPIAYGAILSKEQLDYMMEMMYSIESLQLQAKEKKHHFILANENDNTLGFASYEFNYSETKKTKIHKIYIYYQLSKERELEENLLITLKLKQRNMVKKLYF